jgi:hypothetical protein
VIIDTQLAFNTPRHSEQHTKGWLPVGRDDLVPGKESKPLTFGGISLARRRRFALSPGSVGREARRGKGVWCLLVICSGAEEVTRARARWQDFSFGVVLERRSVVFGVGLVLGLDSLRGGVCCCGLGMRVRCLFCALGCGCCYCRWRWRRGEVMGILGAVEEERRWREVYAGGKGGVEGSGKGVDIINIAGNVCVSHLSLSRVPLQHRHSHRPSLILEAGTRQPTSLIVR